MVEKVNLWFDGSFYVLGSQESRSILRRLDRVIGFPEEGALMLRDFEHALFGGTTVKQLLQGLVKNLAKRKGQHHHRRKEQNTVLHFHRIVAHFYLVSSLLSNINQWAKNKWMKVYFPQLDFHKILGIGIKLKTNFLGAFLGFLAVFKNSQESLITHIFGKYFDFWALAFLRSHFYIFCSITKCVR